MKVITCELYSPIMYSNGSGAEIKGSHIEIKEPTGKIAYLVAILKSQLSVASKNAISGIDFENLLVSEKLSDKTEGDTDKTESDGSSEMEILLLGGADMEKVIICFKQILRETASLGGEKDFNEPMFNRMSYTDVERCLGKYLGNFINQ